MANPALQIVPAPGAERVVSPYQSESKSIFIVFLELFFSRWMLICGIFFSAGFWSYWTLKTSPDTFEATGELLIRRGRVQAVQNVPIMRQQEEVGSEVDILLSIAVLDETVRILLQKAEQQSAQDLAQQPLIFGVYKPGRPYNRLQFSDLPLTDPPAMRKWLKSQLQIRKFGESNVIQVALVSLNPVFAAEAINTLIDVYEKFNLQVERTPGQSAYFRAEIEKVDQEINALEAHLAGFKEKHGVANVDKERELVTLRRHAAQMQLDELQIDKAGLETDLRAVSNPETRLQASFLRNDQAIFKLRENVFHQENQLAELRSRHTEDNPQVVAKREEVLELRANLRREEELAIAQQRHLYRQASDKEAEILSKIAELDRQLGTYPTLEAEISRLDRDIQQRSIKRIDMVEQMFKSATLEDPDETLNKIKVLGYAQVPPQPREARRGFKLLVALVLSLIAAFVVALFVEGLDHSIRKREEIEEQLHVPYLGSLSSHLR